MVATMHKVAAGNGYEYYLRHTAADDTDGRGRESLSDYYAEHGEAPGTWAGTGLDALDIDVGAEVTEAQMRSLFGDGAHPNAEQVRERVTAHHRAAGMGAAEAAKEGEKAARLGNRYPKYTSTSGYRAANAQAYRDHNAKVGACATAHIPEQIRARIRTEVAQRMFTAEHGRAPLDAREMSSWVTKNSRPDRTAVAGFDFTFSPVKSVSVLWALASPQLAGIIATAHRRAVADALIWLEANALYTRMGRNGIRQVRVQGMIAATFTHRDSRAGDPDLHTHVLVANRVRAADGKWRTIDGTTLHEAAVTVSEIYDTRLEHHLETALGLRFAERPARTPDQVRVREIVGVPVPLIHHFSRRGTAITDRLETLTAAWQSAFGRQPEPDEVHDLSQRATLETRPRKKTPTSRTAQRAGWRGEADEVLGGPDAVEAVIRHVLSVPPPTRPPPDHHLIAQLSEQALEALSGKRATWREFNLRAEIERAVRGQVTPADWSRVVEQSYSHAIAPGSAVARGDPDLSEHPELRAVPAWLARRDGTPVHTRANSRIYTTESVLAAESELIALSVQPGGRVLHPFYVADAIDAYNAAHPDRPLNPGQVAVIESFAAAGMAVHTANAAAGTGKTTAMSVLTTAWKSAGGTVIGMAPTAAAAANLGDAIGARAETVDKLLHVLDSHYPRDPTRVYPPPLPQWVLDINDATLVIIDEHVQIPTTKRLQLLRYLTGQGASVRCIGDDHQLPSIDAGGVAADMAHHGPTAPTLTDVVRFTSRGEALASKKLREGDPLALAWYLDHGRIHAGHSGTVYDDTYRAWAADTAAGRDAVMLAPTHDIVTALNIRARADRLARTTPTAPHLDAHVFLAGDLVASGGDTVRTRRNDPRLRIGEHDWVRNGYTWTLREVHPDGSVTVSRRVDGRDTDTVAELPEEYVRQHLHLGYAATIDSAQGITVDTCHVAMSGRESRQQFYVAMTRGRLANHAYLTTALAGAEGDIYTATAHHPRTTVEHLQHVLDRDGAQKSAHTELRDALDPARRIGTAVDTYIDTLTLTAEHAVGPQRLDAIDRAAENLLPGLTDSPAYPVLREHLAMLTLAGTDPVTALREAINTRELDTADDPAAVLDHRLDPTGRHHTGPGPLPWTPGPPTTATADSDTLAPLRARQHIVTELAAQISDTARAWTPTTAPRWAKTLLTNPELVADLAIWRAGLHIPDTDHRPTGPPRHTTIERTHQQQLRQRIHNTDTHSPRHQWAATVDHLDPRISTDPTWPLIAAHIDNAQRAGIDIQQRLTHAAHQRPLPDDMPAAALWARLEIEEADLHTPPQPDHQPPPPAPPPPPQEPTTQGRDITDSIIAATVAGHTAHSTDYDNTEPIDPYQQRQPDKGHDLGW